MTHASIEPCVPCTGTDASQYKIKSAETVHLAMHKSATSRLTLA